MTLKPIIIIVFSLIHLPNQNKVDPSTAKKQVGDFSLISMTIEDVEGLHERFPEH